MATLKTYVRLDGNGKLISGSSVRRLKKPKNGDWIELPNGVCCDPLTICSTTTTP